jgi:surface antigen
MSEAMSDRIETETLSAYVDGELSAEAAGAVERAMAADPAVAASVDALRRDAALVRTAYNEALLAPVPERLLHAIDAAFAARPGGSGGGGEVGGARQAPWRMAVAAAVAALVIGLSGSYFLAEWQVERRIARIESIRTADQRFIEQTIARALEKHVSGTLVEWRNPDSGSQGQVEPVRTFRNASGQFCREYVHRADMRTSGTRQESRRGIACRGSDGKWLTRLVLADES